LPERAIDGRVAERLERERGLIDGSRPARVGSPGAPPAPPEPASPPELDSPAAPASPTFAPAAPPLTAGAADVPPVFAAPPALPPDTTLLRGAYTSSGVSVRQLDATTTPNDASAPARESQRTGSLR
jgi:hypothetical protein